MLSEDENEASYALLGEEESRDNKSLPSFNHKEYSWRKRAIVNSIAVASSVLFFLTIGFVIGIHFHPFNNDNSNSDSATCTQPIVRQEWRSLTTSAQQEYLAAASCLKSKPSRLGENQSLYDDFPWIHFRIGGYAHGAAGFLAWHRLFLDSYEHALREDCGYTGHLVYWDWTLDWQNITEAPVFSTDTFGTNGNPESEEIEGGHCVMDGLFANTTIFYINEDAKSHCLSRGFVNDTTLMELGEMVQPSAIHALLEESDYEAFNLGLEHHAHSAIPNSIRGDFARLTAPSDPLFYLHHTQLDRIWWMWQQRDPAQRLWQYKGKSSHNSSISATLDDVLPLGGLAKDSPVREIMKTQGDLLCYAY